MSPRVAARLAWTLWGLSIGAVVLSAPLAALNDFELGFQWVFSIVAAIAFFERGGGCCLASPRERRRLDLLHYRP